MSDAAGNGVTRTRVIFSGRVQGVSFRATSHELARGFRVVGYVRNAPDGTVELEAEGPADQVRAFLEAIRQRFEGHIDDELDCELPAHAKESEFRILY